MDNEICFEDYIRSPYKKGISNYKLTGRCEDCKNLFTFNKVKYFRRRDWNEKELCQKCYLKHRCYLNEDWIKKNSEAQLIAQNKPEQKLKNSIGVSKSKRWTDEKRLVESEKRLGISYIPDIKMSHYMRQLFKDKIFHKMKCIFNEKFKKYEPVEVVN